VGGSTCDWQRVCGWHSVCGWRRIFPPGAPVPRREPCPLVRRRYHKPRNSYKSLRSEVRAALSCELPRGRASLTTAWLQQRRRAPARSSPELSAARPPAQRPAQALPPRPRAPARLPPDRRAPQCLQPRQRLPRALLRADCAGGLLRRMRPRQRDHVPPVAGQQVGWGLAPAWGGCQRVEACTGVGQDLRTKGRGPGNGGGWLRRRAYRGARGGLPWTFHAPAGAALAARPRPSRCEDARPTPRRTHPSPPPPPRPCARPARPELRLALQSIHTNPAAALAAVPVAPSVVYRPIGPGGVQVTEQEQQVGPGRAGGTAGRWHGERCCARAGSASPGAGA
jgi:hypothetical protein